MIGGTSEMADLKKPKDADYGSDASESENDASSDKEEYHESCWKRDGRLRPVSHIPRIPAPQSEELHRLLTKKEALRELELVWEEREGGGSVWKRWCYQTAKGLFPIMTWLPEYIKREDKWGILCKDVIAGITVGIMAIPQSMSYANIAGLQYVFGMYAIFITCFVYGITGESRQLGVGPVAMVSLIVEAGLTGQITAESCPALQTNTDCETLLPHECCAEDYQKLVFTCSLLVGIINIVGGMMNLGFLVNFLAHPVVSGFTSGAAIIIGLSQIKYIFGFKIEKSQYLYVTVGEILKNIGDTKAAVCILGWLWIFGLSFLGHASKNWPRWKFLRPFGPLIFCVTAIVLMYAWPDLETKYHVEVVGDIPKGFPPESVSDWQFGEIGTVLSTAISASLIGYMESISIGKALAAKHGYKIDAGNEMMALGITNLIGSMFSCYPVTGSFSRSAVNDATGAETQAAGLTTSFIMFLSLLVLTPLFVKLPSFCLAAIVISSVKNLVAYNEAMHLFRVKKTDCFLWVAAFLGTLFLGIQLGIGLAVVLSLVCVIHETVRPQIVVLWRLPHTHVYSSVKTTTHGSFTPGVVVLRCMGSIYFGNSSYLADRIAQILETIRKSETDQVKFVILSLSACTSVDTSAIHALEEINEDLHKRGVRLCFAQVGNRTWRTMNRCGFVKEIGPTWFHDSCHDAVQHCLSWDSSHIEEKHHSHNLEKEKMRLTSPDKQSDRENSLNIRSFGVHV